MPTFRRAAETALAVASIAESRYPADRFQIIVVDSSPDKETEKSLAPLQQELGGQLLFLRKAVAEGPGASRNFGIQSARGEILAFTDSDCMVDPDWIGQGVGPFLHEPRLGIVQGRTLPNPEHPRGASSRFMQVEGPDCVFAACNVFFRKTAFDSVGGFSREFDLPVVEKKPSAAEQILSRIASFHFNALLGFDVDLAWRVLENGWTSNFQSGALVYHAVTPLSPWQWMMEGAYYANAGPPMLKRHPLLRRYMYARFFASKDTALFDLFVLSLLLAFTVHWSALVLTIPYIAHRATGRSRIWRGMLKPFRFVVYVPRDTMILIFSLLSSARNRTFLA